MGFYEIKNMLSKKLSLDFSKIAPTSPNSRGIPAPVGHSTSNTCGTCKECQDYCPTEAIGVDAKEVLNIDYGKCLQCGICVKACPKSILKNTGFVHVLAFQKEELRIQFQNGDFEPKEFDTPENILEFVKLTNRNGFKFREVAASGNNAVECEINASFNNVFDSEGNQAVSVASPKHADAIVFSGPVGKEMVYPLSSAWECIPAPKALIANGTEAISGGLFKEGGRPKNPDLFIGGDPPRPDVMISGYRKLMGRYQFSFQKEFKNFLLKMKETIK